MGDKDSGSRLKEWLTSGQARLQPLTLPQRELWENSPVDPGDPANHICSIFEIQGSITFEQVKDAIAQVLQRQEVMRTSIVPGREQAVQIIRSTGEPAIRYRELTDEETSPEALQAVMAECFLEPFDMLRGPLYRADLLRRGPEDHVLAFTLHHAIGDGWTLGAFVEDLCTAYIIAVRGAGKKIDDATVDGVRGLRESLPPPPMTYNEWGAAERARWTEAELQPHLDYWKTRLAGSKRLFDDGTANPDRQKGPLDQWVTALPDDLSDAARKLARQSKSTIFNTLLAVFQLTLYRWTGIDDITVGTPVANRAGTSISETMGSFAGIVPLRGRVDPSQPFADRLRRVNERTMDDFAHAIPFAELAKALAPPAEAGRHTIFDTRFALQNHPIPDVELPGISTRLRTCSTGTARFDLGCEFTEEDGGFEVVWLYRPSVVSTADVRELDHLYHEVLGAVCRQPDIHPSAMSV